MAAVKTSFFMGFLLLFSRRDYTCIAKGGTAFGVASDFAKRCITIIGTSDSLAVSSARSEVACGLRCVTAGELACRAFLYDETKMECSMIKRDHMLSFCYNNTVGKQVQAWVLSSTTGTEDNSYMPEKIAGVQLVSRFLIGEPTCLFCFTSDGNIVLPERMGKNVRIYTNSGLLVREFNMSAGSPDSLYGAARREMTLFITDVSGNCIHVCSENGNYNHKMPLPPTYRPMGISIDGNKLYVGMNDQSEVYVVTLNASNHYVSYTVIPVLNTFQLNTVNVFGPTIMVTAFGTDDVKVIGYAPPTPLFTVFDYGGFGNGTGQLTDPFGGHIDQWGRSIVSDRENKRIVLISACGDHLADLVTVDDGLYGGPMGLAVKGDMLYVVSSFPHYVHRFRIIGL